MVGLPKRTKFDKLVPMMKRVTTMLVGLMIVTAAFAGQPETIIKNRVQAVQSVNNTKQYVPTTNVVSKTNVTFHSEPVKHHLRNKYHKVGGL